MAKLDHARRVVKYEIFGLVLLVLGIVTLGDLGAVGQSLDDLCVMLAGNWHFLIPLYVIWAAVFVMIRRSRFRYTGMQIGIVIVCFVILTWSELDLFSLAVQGYGAGHAPDLLQITQNGIKSLEESLKTEIVTGSGQVLPPDNAGGGMIGYALFTGMEYLFALTGTLLVLVVATLVAAILITRRSLVATIERASMYFENRMSRGWSRAMRAAARMLGGRGERVGASVKAPARTADDDPEGDEDGRTEEEESVPRRSQKRGGSRKRTRRETGAALQAEGPEVDDAREESGQDSQDGMDEGTFFPFPDFVAPYAQEPSYETFLVPGAAKEGDGFEAASPVGGKSRAGRIITTDERTARMTLYVTPQPQILLAPDPVHSLPESPFSGELDLFDESAEIHATGSAGEEAEGNREAQGSGAGAYRLPDARLLQRASHRRTDGAASVRELSANEKKLAETFESFGVQVKVLGHSRGPAVTRYEIQPAVGVKVSRIVNLADDLALALAARDIRIEAPIPGRSAIGIEVPNTEISIVTFRDVVETAAFRSAPSLLAFALGHDIAGNTVIGDLAKMPHVLVAGATGSGKSVCINCIIGSILFRARPDEVKFIMIDPKMVELGVYADIPHLFAPVVTEARRAAAVLRKVVAEMEHRYELFHGAKVRDLERYNAYAAKQGKPKLPLIVVIIDELADLMMVAARDVEDAICRLAQMARASGIHLVVATQRPSVDVITGLIKTNIPSRIAFAVSSGVDSRTILDGGGAEKLLGRGDMLYLPVGAPKPVRLQGAFLSEAEVERLVDFVRNQQEADYADDFTNVSDEKPEAESELDPLFEDAVKLVMDSQQASTTFIQRRLSVGYARAARLVDTMEQMGIIGPYVNSRPREILMTHDQWLSRRPEP